MTATELRRQVEGDVIWAIGAGIALAIRAGRSCGKRLGRLTAGVLTVTEWGLHTVSTTRVGDPHEG